jgi:hypothetical protein
VESCIGASHFAPKILCEGCEGFFYISSTS